MRKSDGFSIVDADSILDLVKQLEEWENVLQSIGVAAATGVICWMHNKEVGETFEAIRDMAKKALEMKKDG